ncbi:ATP-dependent Clp protease ATP-binding subunit [Mariniphaga sediminis]|uniref:ATP-dependent Clp protease ATP-binding subunit n=2 Tax=Mariniphaga sediminis TaxID=1628158 RepID=A0A399D167_9BACT|nr:ATP-dependent Clp protease ATP-binding subunit [Mariniphaga sediminis]RIH65307.1 ATP-dependent Clp protease ATP-binding subunit [Mariniphaga sediminis]
MTFTGELKQAINIAQSIAKEYSNGEFSPAHLLKALLHKDIGLTELLLALEQDIYYLEEWAEVRIEACSKSGNVHENPSGDSQVQAVFREADNIRLKLSKEEIDPVSVLAALSTPGVGFSYEQLKTFTLTQKQIIDYLLEDSELQHAVGIDDDSKNEEKKQKPSQNALLKYCTDKNEEAQQGKLDPVVSRDNTIREIIEILGRRNKANVLIVGDAGVGKTSLVNGFTQNVVEEKVPGSLLGAVVFELDYGALIAGASYKGEIEDRLKKIISEIQQFDKAILFVDEIHMLLDKQGGTAGAANLLKPELARGNLTIIGTTTIENYTKFIETDEAFNRQFELVKVEEPDEETAKRMLKEIVPKYEEHHGLKVDEEVITEAIRLSKRFLKEQLLPESAIDLIDHTMAGVRLMADISPVKIEKLKADLNQFADDKEAHFVELQWFSSDLKNQISPILFSKLDEEENGLPLESGTETFGYCQKVLDKLEEVAKEKVESLKKSDIGAIVSGRTGIPLGKIQSKEREKLLNTEEHLRKRVIGQDHALKSIAEAILESRSGLNKAGQPIGSFFFLGPTGTGKTELAKSLAEFLFQDESFLIRFDMSEFKEEHSAALLYGAPPGYVGYEEGGLLVNKIRQKPYSIVLFDEIEKAHSSVFDIFLQILDEGKLHDRLGKEGDFSNALILFTSNIGSDYIVESFNKGEIPPSDTLMEIMSNYFRPEFLGRLTEIVPFAPISKNNVVKIFDIHLKSLLKTLDDKGVQLEIDDNAKEKLALSGYTPKYGARPIVGVIRSQLRRPLSQMIISDKIKRGSVVRLSLDENEKVVWKTD